MMNNAIAKIGPSAAELPKLDNNKIAQANKIVLPEDNIAGPTALIATYMA